MAIDFTCVDLKVSQVWSNRRRWKNNGHIRLGHTTKNGKITIFDLFQCDIVIFLT
jgi:hypothetical protein